MRDNARHAAVFDKQTTRSWVAAIRDTACERGFNEVVVDGTKHSFEEFFQASDDALGDLLLAVHSERDLRALTSTQLNAIPKVVALQIARTKLSRLTIRSLAIQMREQIANAMPDADLSGIRIPDEEDLKRVAAVPMDLAPLVKALATKMPLLIQVEDGPLSVNVKIVVA